MEPQKSTTNVPEKLLKPYEPTVEEKVVYELWEKSGYFNPDKMISDGLISENAEAYTIVLPPPNVTGTLHMGHALGGTVQDILIRYKRMRGFKTLWIPGTDHAAIATQSKVEKDIKKKEGLSRHDLGREELLKRVSAFAQESHDTMVNQIKTLGFSCDWSREAFTLDQKRNLAVRTIFKKMYDDGLIVRKNKIINWDPKGQTTISDDEIVRVDRKSKLYTFKYSHDFPIAISTTRPETKVGDVAVAVHPDDTRYTEYVGKEYDAVFCGAPIHIKIVADSSVEKDFGTGALGVTPAHSQTDWEISDRHDLPRPQIINEYAKIINVPETSPVYDKKVAEARGIIVAWLKEQNLLSRLEVKPQDNPFTMPRPMMHSGDYDFSFSGIKTAMLYAIRDLTEQNTRELNDEEKKALACAFEDAAIEVLIHKTLKAVREHNAQTLIVGGGVAGNTYLRAQLGGRTAKDFSNVNLLFPEPWLATDNAVMIGMAAMLQIFSGEIKTAPSIELKADGNLSL